MITRQVKARTMFACCVGALISLVGPDVAADTTTGMATHTPTDLAHSPGWRACTAIPDENRRLVCFDEWTRAQSSAQSGAQPNSSLPRTSPPRSGLSSDPPPSATGLVTASMSRVAQGLNLDTMSCRDAGSSTPTSRFWELESASDCGTLSLRGYRPVSLSLVSANTVNRMPSSPAPGRTAAGPVDYRHTEVRVQLSVRAKLVRGLLTDSDSGQHDSLWFAYTQQSYWQLFSGKISRPFRATDHEPEVIYVYPFDVALPAGWRMRYAGAGFVHQSNGQSLPMSRSWNRGYVMAGAELGDRWQVQARLWRRSYAGDRDDDNPGMQDYIGRAELRVLWNPNAANTLGLTIRHSLRTDGRGSARFEWLRSLGQGSNGSPSNLRLHAQFFTGYGDSLIDYNFRRNVFSLGLSLLDF